MTRQKLRTGLFVVNSETNTDGVVIDWGIRDIKLRRYVPFPAYIKTAEWVRVWTSSGKTMEVWPFASIKVQR